MDRKSGSGRKEKRMDKNGMTNPEDVKTEEMEKVTGGSAAYSGGTCPECGSTNTELTILHPSRKTTVFYRVCKDCGHIWHKSDTEPDNPGVKQ